MLDKIKKNICILCLSMVLFSIFLFWLSEQINIGTIKLIISNLGGVLFISGIFTIIDKYITQRNLVSLVTEKINLKNEIDESGVIKLVKNLGDLEYRQYFGQAKSNIDILHIYGRTWTTTYIDDIYDAIKRGCCVRVVLMDENSPFLGALATHFEYGENKLKEYIQNVSREWKDKCYSNIEQIERIKLYYHSGQPTNSLYRIDNIMIAIQTKSTRKKTTKLPALVFEKNDNEGNFFNLYLDELENLIKESREINFDEI